MFARIPLRYRVVVWTLGLLNCAGVGAWLAVTLPVPLRLGSGALVGSMLGVAATLYFLHDLEDRHPVRHTVHRR